jgi:hypothetical protein
MLSISRFISERCQEDSKGSPSSVGNSTAGTEIMPIFFDAIVSVCAAMSVPPFKVLIKDYTFLKSSKTQQAL